MSQQIQKLRAEIATSLAQNNPVVVENIEGAELEQFERMSVGDGLTFLLARCNGHPTARSVRKILRTADYPRIMINGRDAALQSNRMSEFIAPGRRPAGSEGDQGPRRIEELRISVSEQQSGG